MLVVRASVTALTVCAVGVVTAMLLHERQSPAPVPPAPPPVPPAPPAKPAMPTIAVPCVVEPATLHAADGLPVLCGFDGACIALDGAQVRAARKPPDEPSPFANVHRGAAPTLCFGARCVPLGPKLVATLGDEQSVDATADLGAVVIGTTLWNVARDREVALPPPPKAPDERRVPNGFHVNGITPVGNVVRIDWISCAADGCTRSAMVDSSGRDLHQNLGGGEERAIRLTDKLYVQLAVSGDAELLDADGHLHSQRRFGDDRDVTLHAPWQ
jgi:hypothetical protein